MLLYHAASSYYSMIARLALREAGIAYDERRIDIHRAREQLAPWYVAINPHMTVPTLVDGTAAWRDSRDILAVAAARAGAKWATPSADIEAVVAAHYAIPIERLTFARMMTRIPPLRVLFPRMLRRIVRDLEAALPTAADPDAVRAKIAVDRERVAYFGGGDLRGKLEAERDHVRRFLAALPAPADLLFGARFSSADVVTIVLLARLKMIGEGALTGARADIARYFDRIVARPAFVAADVWTRFQLRRMLSGD